MVAVMDGIAATISQTRPVDAASSGARRRRPEASTPAFTRDGAALARDDGFRLPRRHGGLMTIRPIRPIGARAWHVRHAHRVID